MPGRTLSGSLFLSLHTALFALALATISLDGLQRNMSSFYYSICIVFLRSGGNAGSRQQDAAV